jgi:hypothetical protein
MNIKDLYIKFKDSVEPITDEELKVLIDHFTKLDKLLNLGPRFGFAREEVWRCLDQFNRWDASRKNKY